MAIVYGSPARRPLPNRTGGQLSVTSSQFKEGGAGGTHEG